MANLVKVKHTTGLNLNGDVYPISAWSTTTIPAMTTAPTYSHYIGPMEYQPYYTTCTTPTQYVATELEKYLYKPITQQSLHEIKYILDSTSTATTGIMLNGMPFSDYTTGMWNSTNVRHVPFNPFPADEFGIVYYGGVVQASGLLAGGLQSSKDIKRTRLKSNLIVVKNSRANYNGDVAPNEQIALDTLREVVTEYEFRKYLKYGFVLVKGKSGDTYQIFRNKSHTKVWRDGRVIEEICVRIADAMVPKTDNVIAFKAIIETDEVSFKKMGNVYKFKAA